MSEVESITQHFQCLSNLKRKSSFVLEYQPFDIIEKQSLSNGDRIIGRKTGKFTLENYEEKYREVIKENNWQIRLLDDSFISMYYLFDKNGQVKSYSLSFIPNIDEDSLAGNPSNSDRYETLIPSFTSYMRIDFDEIGFQSRIHELQHFHKGLSNRVKNNTIDEQFSGQSDPESYLNELRLPVKRILYPTDFIKFVLEYIYHEEIDITDIIQLEDKRIVISEAEQNFCIDNSY